MRFFLSNQTQSIFEYGTLQLPLFRSKIVRPPKIKNGPGTKEIEQSPGGLNAFLPLGGQSCPSPQNVFHEIEDGKRILREIRLLVWLFLDDCFSTHVCDHAAERPDHPDMEGFLVFLGGGMNP